MIKIIIYIIAVLSGVTSIIAEPINVRSGEHKEFVRLVLDIKVESKWTVKKEGTNVKIIFKNHNQGFTTSRIFERINTDIIDSVSQSASSLNINLTCDCQIHYEVYKRSMLALDILRDPPETSKIQTLTKNNGVKINIEQSPKLRDFLSNQTHVQGAKLSQKKTNGLRNFIKNNYTKLSHRSFKDLSIQISPSKHLELSNRGNQDYYGALSLKNRFITHPKPPKHKNTQEECNHKTLSPFPNGSIEDSLNIISELKKNHTKSNEQIKKDLIKHYLYLGMATEAIKLIYREKHNKKHLYYPILNLAYLLEGSFSNIIIAFKEESLCYYKNPLINVMIPTEIESISLLNIKKYVEAINILPIYTRNQLSFNLAKFLILENKPLAANYLLKNSTYDYSVFTNLNSDSYSMGTLDLIGLASLSTRGIDYSLWKSFIQKHLSYSPRNPNEGNNSNYHEAIEAFIMELPQSKTRDYIITSKVKNMLDNQLYTQIFSALSDNIFNLEIGTQLRLKSRVIMHLFKHGEDGELIAFISKNSPFSIAKVSKVTQLMIQQRIERLGLLDAIMIKGGVSKNTIVITVKEREENITVNNKSYDKNNVVGISDKKQAKELTSKGNIINKSFRIAKSSSEFRKSIQRSILEK